VAVPEWSLSYINQHGQPRDLQVLTCIASMINLHNKSVTASVADISKVANTSRETVKRSLKWLEDHNLITVVGSKPPKPNTYTIHYTQQIIGSPMTQYRVTDDPVSGSLMTPLTTPNRVTDDPFKTIELPACGNNLDSPRVIVLLNKESTEVLQKANGVDDKVDTMILGADPNETKPSDDAPKRKTRPEVNPLVNYFVYHPKSIMNSAYSFQDVQILRRTIRLLLDAGLTRPSIANMIDKFFSTENLRSADSPIRMFSSKSVQQSLMDKIETSLDENTSPVLTLMLNDFNRGDLELPWDSATDEYLRKIVILVGMDVCYRYPEIVARLIESSTDISGKDFKEKLSALNSLVKWHLGEEECDNEKLISTLSGTTLPKELLATSRSNLRPAADTIISAIYNYRRGSYGS